MSETQEAPLSFFEEFLLSLSAAPSLDVLNALLVEFQEAYKRGAFTPEQVSLLVEVGKKKRALLTSKAEEKKKSAARQAIEKATYQGVGGVPRPNPHLMTKDEYELYQFIINLDANLPDAFTQLERLELRYAERERGDYAKEWLVPAVTDKLAEISDAWAKKADGK